jgi:hypothetical protein
MKLVRKVLNYRTCTTEETGIWIEKIICDILKIKFNTKRKYIVKENSIDYPLKMKRDIEYTLRYMLKRLKINEHVGNKNEYNDFVTGDNKTVSLKTNINGYKMCSQIIGQCSLKKLNEKLDKNFTKDTYKKYVIKNTRIIINEYLKYLFCCDHLLSVKFNDGKVYCLNNFNEDNEDNEIVFLDKTVKLELSKNKIKDWNESNTVKIKYDNTFLSLAEIQVHNSRNSIKCRFNFDTVLKLVRGNVIKNITLQEFDLKYKYIIKVVKEK